MSIVVVGIANVPSVKLLMLLTLVKIEVEVVVLVISALSDDALLMLL